MTTTNDRPWEIVVTEGYNDAAVKAAVDEALASRTGNAVRKTIVLPPGDFHLKNPLITQSKGNTAQVEGLSIRGQGKRLTKIYVDTSPIASTDPWANNFITAHGLRYFTLRDFTVVSQNENNNFAYLWSLATGPYNQEWNIKSVEFQGPWNRVLGFDGDSTSNLNSEFVIDRTSTATNSRYKDAFMRVGGISGTYNQQNQFLNYWVTNTQFVLTEGTVFRLDKGGSLRVDRGSWSAATSNTNAIKFFHMPLANHNNRSAAQLSVRDVRFEPKGPDHKIIDCGWASGSVSFENCIDLSSIQHTAGMEYNLHKYTGASPWGFGVGPMVRYKNHQGAGYHLYDGPAQSRGNIAYEGCYFYRGGNGQKAPATQVAGSALRWTSGTPKYRFSDCDNVDNVSN